MNDLKDKFFKLVGQEPTFFAQHGVKEIGLFGSVARGEDTDGSDVDILVSFQEGRKNFKNFVAVVDFLESRLGCSVDLVTKESLSPYLGPHILEEVEYVPLAS